MDFHGYCKPVGKFSMIDSDDESDNVIIQKIDDSDIKLIETVKEFPCIYLNKKKNDKEIAEAWTSVSHKLNRDECQEAWLNLRKEYPKDRKRREKEGTCSVTQLSLYDFMKWIDPYVPRRNSKPRIKVATKPSILPKKQNLEVDAYKKVESENVTPSTTGFLIEDRTESCNSEKTRTEDDLNVLQKGAQMDDNDCSNQNILLDDLSLNNIQIDKICTDQSIIAKLPKAINAEETCSDQIVKTLCNETFQPNIIHKDISLSSSKAFPDATLHNNTVKHSIAKIHEETNRHLKDITNKLLDKLGESTVTGKEKECKYDEENHILGRLLTNNLKKIKEPLLKSKFKLDITQILYNDD